MWLRVRFGIVRLAYVVPWGHKPNSNMYQPGTILWGSHSVPTKERAISSGKRGTLFYFTNKSTTPILYPGCYSRRSQNCKVNKTSNGVTPFITRLIYKMCKKFIKVIIYRPCGCRESSDETIDCEDLLEDKCAGV